MVTLNLNGITIEVPDNEKDFYIRQGYQVVTLEVKVKPQDEPEEQIAMPVTPKKKKQ